jgi:hypothetical protein
MIDPVRGRVRIGLLAGFLLLLAGACAQNRLEPYVPAHCHGSALAFETYTVSYEEVPGFIVDVVDTSLRGALDRQGLRAVETPTDADILVQSTLEIIDHNPPKELPRQNSQRSSQSNYPMGQPLRDSFGESFDSNDLNRFVTHLMIDVIDQRTDTLIWKGSIDRSHAIMGGETFHDARAVLQISQALDEMFVGLTTPCE